MDGIGVCCLASEIHEHALRILMSEFVIKLVERMFRRDRIAWLVKQGLTVGRNFSLLEDVYIDPSHLWLIVIGNDVTLAPRAQILAHDASTKQYLGKTRLGKVVIGDRVFVGASAIILPGITIGSEVIIGAGSVVTKDIPSGVVAAGNPARVHCTIQQFLKRRREEMGALPNFGREYTLAGNITEEKKSEMNSKIRQFGYIS